MARPFAALSKTASALAGQVFCGRSPVNDLRSSGPMTPQRLHFATKYSTEA